MHGSSGPDISGGRPPSPASSVVTDNTEISSSATKRAWLEGGAGSDLQEKLLQAAAMPTVLKLFDLHKLAKLTTGGSWLTAWQLLCREAYDSLQERVDDRHVPVSAWADKVALALFECRADQGPP